MSWKDSKAFIKHILNCETVMHPVNGEAMEFYPISTGMVFKLRKLGKPVALAMSVLFDHERMFSSARASRITHSGDYTESINEGMAVESMSLLYSKQKEAMENLIDGLISEESLDAIGEIILDSVHRSLFPNLPREGLPGGHEFLMEIGLPRMPELLIGVAKANKGVLGPLEGELASALSRATSAVTKGMTRRLQDSEPTGQASEGAEEEPAMAEGRDGWTVGAI